MAGIFLVTLSVSVAFGAAPADTRDATRGQTIASFVHDLVFGNHAEEPAEDEVVAEGEAPPAEESELEAELEENEPDEESDAHGQCVSEVAQDPDAIGGPNNNHGGAVSEAARETCRDADESDEADEVLEEEEAQQEEDAIDEDEEADSHGACVSEVARDTSAIGGKNNNHGGAVSEAARETCHDAEEDGEEAADSGELELAAATEEPNASKAAKADRENGKPSWAGNGAGNGNGKGDDGGKGNGRGGGGGGGRP